MDNILHTSQLLFNDVSNPSDYLAFAVCKQARFLYGGACGFCAIVGNSKGRPEDYGEFSPVNTLAGLYGLPKLVSKRFELSVPAWLSLNLFTGKKIYMPGNKFQYRGNANVQTLCSIGLDFDPITKGEIIDHVQVRQFIENRCDQFALPRPNAYGIGCGLWAYWLIEPIPATPSTKSQYRGVRSPIASIFEDGCRKYECRIDPLGGVSPCSITKVVNSQSDKKGVLITHRFETVHSERIKLCDLHRIVSVQSSLHPTTTQKLSPTKKRNKLNESLKKAPSTKKIRRFKKSSSNRCIQSRAKLIRFLADNGHKIDHGGHHSFIRVCCNAFHYGEKLNGQLLHQAVEGICERVLVNVQNPNRIKKIIQDFIVRAHRWAATDGSEGDGPKIKNHKFFNDLGVENPFMALFVIRKFPYADIRGRRAFTRWAIKQFPQLSHLNFIKVITLRRWEMYQYKINLIKKYSNTVPARTLATAIYTNYGIKIGVESIWKIRQKIDKAHLDVSSHAVSA